jgi:BirA family transcriptional regulator, biotin operon repressor / biotin---[acetyl-CoA-carboxylase] ligase
MNQQAPTLAQAWGVLALEHQLKSVLAGLTVELVAHTQSTNSDLMARPRGELGDVAAAQVRPSRESAAFGLRLASPSPCLRVAEHQSAGRGRQDRVWHSVPGASLTFSLGLCMARADLSGLSLAMGVALTEALQPAGWVGPAPHVALKWPNDLWLMDAACAGRKLGGVLVETQSLGHGQRWVVVGVGLNILLLMAPEFQWVTSGFAAVQEIQPQATAPQVLTQTALPLVQALQQFEREGFAPFAARFGKLDMLRGQVVATTQTGVSEGVAQGVSQRGELLVQTPGGVQPVASGEVSVRLRGATA